MHIQVHINNVGFLQMDVIGEVYFLSLILLNNLNIMLIHRISHR